MPRPLRSVFTSFDSPRTAVSFNAMHCTTLRSTSRPFVGARAPCVRPCVAPTQRGDLIVRNAHKKGSGSTKNGRDSNSKSRGVKVFGGQPVTAGGIIVRQLGNKWHAGNNVGTGKDYTLFSLNEGIVVFETIKRKSCVSVYPDGHAKTEGLRLKRQPDSHASKRLEKWKGTPRRQARADSE